MKLYFTTVVRSAPVSQGGEIVLLDWDKKKILRREPLWPENPKVNDPNPRGNSRGGRGIQIMDDKVIVATYHTLKVFDLDLKHLYDLSHGLMVGLHETALDRDGIWVASTSIDAALKYDWSGDLVAEYWPREMPNISRNLNVKPLTINKKSDQRLSFLETKTHMNSDHLHLNALAVYDDQLYGLLNGYGAIVNLTKDEIVFQTQEIQGAHNLLFKDSGRLFVNNTKRHSVEICDLQRGEITHKYRMGRYPPVRNLIRKKVNIFARLTGRCFSLLPKSARHAIHSHITSKCGANLPVSIAAPLFMRGLSKSENLLFVGFSPASIVCIDLKDNSLRDMYTYTDDVRVAVHGLSISI